MYVKRLCAELKEVVEYLVIKAFSQNKLNWGEKTR